MILCGVTKAEQAFVARFLRAAHLDEPVAVHKR